MIKKLESIISTLKGTASRAVKKNIKFGIRVPQTVNEAMRLDKKNCNRLCRDGTAEDIDGVMISFKILNEGEKPLLTYQEIICHMIIDINMEYLRQKARYVAGGHTTVAPPTLKYAIVVLREISALLSRLLH